MVIGVDDALILAGIAAASGAASYMGTKQTNSANAAQNANTMRWQFDIDQWNMANQRAFFNETMDFNREQANLARTFAQYNANTSYQRARSDMLAAGLNPILAYAQGGAPAPTVSAASVGTPSASVHGAPAQHRMENALGPAVGSALQAASTVMGVQQAAAQIDQTKAQTSLAAASTANQKSQAALNSAQAITEAQRTGLVKSQRASEMVLPALREAQAASASASAGELAAREAAVRQETEHYNRYGYGQSGREASSVAGIGRTVGGSAAEVTRRPARAAGEAVGSASRRLLDQWRSGALTPSAPIRVPGTTPGDNRTLEEVLQGVWNRFRR